MKRPFATTGALRENRGMLHLTVNIPASVLEALSSKLPQDADAIARRAVQDQAQRLRDQAKVHLAEASEAYRLTESVDRA